ncbi:hypothetical protein [Glutamicibacter creatinolyticus]|uniref:hypothetical protein n=1 Tax=Glutamicibacter creatinolyticus TaxID=162496 RepID=UPI0037C034F4
MDATWAATVADTEWATNVTCSSPGGMASMTSWACSLRVPVPSGNCTTSVPSRT